MGAPVFLGIAAVSSALSGAVGYIGAQRQAQGMEAQAKAAEQQAAFNAQVARNNAQAQAQDLQHQAGVERFNQRLAQRETAFALKQQRDKTERRVASATASAAKRGTFEYSFEDILRSEEALAGEQEAETLFQGREQGYQRSTQANLNQFMAGRAIEEGRTQSALITSSGAQRSAALSGQADSARIGGFGSLIGGFGGAASYASQIEF